MMANATQWTSEEVAAAVGGRLHGAAGVRFDGIATDTRDDLTGRLYIALRGEHFDAHDFLEAAVGRGARGLLIGGSPRAPQNAVLAALAQRVPVIVTADSLSALADLAGAHRRRLDRPVIALTGSNGKTTTKEMIAAILCERCNVLKTLGNLNNLIGLPLTLLNLAPEHQIAVLEMGMNARGEIATLTRVAEPNIGLVLNVGPAHIGFLGSLQAIGDAKGELYAGLARPDAVAIVNADDPEVVRVAQGLRRTRTFGTRAGVQVQVLSAEPLAEGQRVHFVVDGQPLEVVLPYPGRHNTLNAAAAIATVTAPIGEPLPIDFEAIRTGLARAEQVKGRLQFERVRSTWIVDDGYNANAASMLAAFETVAVRARAQGGRWIALLGEMRELGEHSRAEHQRVGIAAAQNGAAAVAAFGPEAGPIATGARGQGTPAHHEFDDVEQLLGWLLPLLRAGDVVLVKGSRGIQMERFIARLRVEVT